MDPLTARKTLDALLGPSFDHWIISDEWAIAFAALAEDQILSGE